MNKVAVTELVKRGDIVEIQDGNHGNDHPLSEEYVTSGVPFILARDIKKGSVDYSTCNFLKPDRARMLRVGFAHPGDILLTHKGTVGEVALVPETYPVTILTPQVTYYRLNPNGELNGKYLYHILQCRDVQHYIKLWSKQSTRSYLSISAQKKLILPICGKKKQIKISEVIDKFDFNILTTQQLIAAKEKAYSTYVTTLLDPNNFTKSTEYHFEQLFTPKNNKNFNKDNLELLSVTKNGIVMQRDYFNKDIASSDLSKYLIAFRHDLVMSGLNFWMGAIDFQEICDAGLVSPAYKLFELNGALADFSYMRHYVRSKNMLRILMRASVQGASIVRRNIDIDQLEQSKIILPPMEKQKSIGHLLDLKKQEVNLLSSLLRKYREQKRGLMQKLLTGEWTVKSLE
jgi:type I restriction enzyme S subunit